MDIKGGQKVEKIEQIVHFINFVHRARILAMWTKNWGQSGCCPLCNKDWGHRTQGPNVKPHAKVLKIMKHVYCNWKALLRHDG